MSGTAEGDPGRWFPICSREDVPAAHVFETELRGHELAVWRGPNGGVNVWENRCPHRGMRLTVGAILGAELRCAYHGYRYRDGSGACTAVPAQPDKAPPRILCVKTYPALEAGGLIWTRRADPAATPPLTPLPGAAPVTTLYALAVNSPPAAVARYLTGYRFRPTAALTMPRAADEACATTQIDAYDFQSIARNGFLRTEVRLFLQPVDAQTSIIHGILCEHPDEPLRMAALRHHAQRLGRLRDACERSVPPGIGAGAP